MLRLVSVFLLGLAAIHSPENNVRDEPYTPPKELAMSRTQTATASTIAPARDGNIAIQEELDAARSAGTVEAYELFLNRHPDHSLSKVAREELDRLRKPVSKP